MVVIRVLICYIGVRGKAQAKPQTNRTKDKGQAHKRKRKAPRKKVCMTMTSHQKNVMPIVRTVKIFLDSDMSEKTCPKAGNFRRDLSRGE